MLSFVSISAPYIVCYVTTAIVVVAPYVVALIAGFVNGSFLKFRNLDRHIGQGEVATYNTKISYFAAIAVSLFYCIGIIGVVWLLCIYLLGIFTMSFSAIIFPAIALFGLHAVLYLFCEMRIVGGRIYFYDLFTMFNVVTIEVDDIVTYRSDGFTLLSWVSFKTKVDNYYFVCISNIDEFIDAINGLKGGTNE